MINENTIYLYKLNNKIIHYKKYDIGENTTYLDHA